MARLTTWAFGTVICLTTLLLYTTWTKSDNLLEIWTTNTSSISRLDSTATRRYAGVPGFQVFDHLWYKDKTFYAFTDDALGVDATEVVNWPTSFTILPLSERPSKGRGMAVHKLAGTSIWDNSHPSVHPMLLAWYYHFAAETILGATSALSAASVAHESLLKRIGRSDFNRGIKQEEEETKEAAAERLREGVPDRMVIPWVEGWRDQYGIQEVLARGLWGNDMIEPEEWRELEGDGKDWVYFERDRQISTHHPLVQTWNKMALGAFHLPHRHTFFEPVRQKLLDSLHLQEVMETHKTSQREGRVKIVYIDRQDTDRRLSDEAQDTVLEVLKGVAEADGSVDVKHGLFGQAGVEEQIKMVADADIIVGVHGNGLTHQLWMPPGGTVLELFPKDAFLRDYQVVAEVLGHRHICFRENEILPKAEWEKIQGERNPSYLHDGRRIEVDAVLLEKTLRAEIDRIRHV